MDIAANIHVCVFIAANIHVSGNCFRSSLMWNESHVHILGLGIVFLKFTLVKMMQLKNVHHVPSIKKNLVSDSLLY